MNIIKTAIIAILVFGFLIFIHEFGHYIFARIFKVTITEFSIGMGPKLLWYDSKKTGIKYAISAIPFGGYVAMVGEDGESEDPNAFNKKPAWQRLIITVAGAAINIIAGVIAITILASFTNLGDTTVNDFYKNIYEVSSYDSGLRVGDEIVWVDGKSVETSTELYEAIQTKGHEPLEIKVIRDGKTVTLEDVKFPIMERSNGEQVVLVDFNVEGTKNIVTLFYRSVYEVSSSDSGLEKGDKVIKVDGKRVRNLDALSYEIMRKGYEPIDITVIRNGEEKTIENVVFPVSEEQGQKFGLLDFQVRRIEKNFFKVIGYSISKSALIVRMCWESIIDLITGRYTLSAVSGPVGISQAIGSAANEGFLSLLSIVGLISINLGVMNLLPLPALDGGRLGMILAEMITRKKIPTKIEATINAVGLAVLLGLSAVIMVKDIFGLFR